MPTKLRITFTGMCLFRNDEDGVLVELADASVAQRYGGHTLEPHVPCIIGAENHLEGPKSGYDSVPIERADWEFIGQAGGPKLTKPDHVAEVTDFDPDAAPNPQRRAREERVVARIRLRGGRFTDAPRRNPQGGTGRSGPWHDPRGGGATRRYYWQVTWEGMIDSDSVTLDLGSRAVTLKAQHGSIDFVVANLPPDEVDAWKSGADLDGSMPGGGQAAHHYLWFFWMLDLPPSSAQQVPTTANKGALGLAYTCLVGGD